jgi:uncharacterized protein YjiK
MKNPYKYANTQIHKHSSSMKNWLFLFSLLFFLACENTPKNAPPETQPANTAEPPTPPEAVDLAENPPPLPYNFAYQLNKPNATFSLPGRLTEISGLSLSPDGQFLLANNDEDGKIFYLDKTNGKVKEEIKFESSGDYEGIEMANERIYVVKSNGTIYEVKNPGQKNQETVTHKTSLNSDNNVEGLAFDPNTGYLLLACKGKAGDGDNMKHKRAVYGYDISRKNLIETPVFLIDRDEIQKWAEKGKESLTKKLAEFFEPSLAGDAFAPSGIAIHPLTREIYVVSSVGKILVVIDSTGKILHIEPLDPDIFKQPEGICFDRDGTLFISTEGKGGMGKIFRFGLQ